MIVKLQKHESAVKNGMLSEEDTKIFYVTDDIDETVGILKDQYLGRTESVITDDKNPK